LNRVVACLADTVGVLLFNSGFLDDDLKTTDIYANVKTHAAEMKTHTGFSKNSKNPETILNSVWWHEKSDGGDKEDTPVAAENQQVPGPVGAGTKNVGDKEEGATAVEKNQPGSGPDVAGANNGSE
jgi:hypothetical protein